LIATLKIINCNFRLSILNINGKAEFVPILVGQ